jgi:hypothetical protein
MKTIVYILFFASLSIVTTFSQPSIEWIKSIGDSSYYEDGGYSLQKTSDGGYVILGNHEITKSYVAKLNSNGDTLWTKQYDIEIEPYNKKTLCQSSTGDFYFSNGFRGITKVNSNSDSIWFNNYSIYGLYSLTYTSDDCIVASGSFGQSNPGILKIDLMGSVIWEKYFNTQRYVQFNSICETNDHGFISVGVIDSLDMSDIFIIRYNSEGDTIWTKVISSQYTTEYAGDLIQNEDGTFTICGAAFFGNNDYDVLILKIDFDGSIIWLKTYGGAKFEFSFDLCTTFDNGYILVGRQGFSSYLLRTDTNGDTLWTTSIEGDFLYSVFYNDDKSFLVGGYIFDYDAGHEDLLVVKFAPEVSNVNEQILSPNEFTLFQNYPNPFNPSSNISWQSPVGSWQTLKIYDVLGNEVATLVDEYKPAGKYEVEFNSSSGIRDLASGIYFYQLKIENYVETKKMILLK